MKKLIVVRHAKSSWAKNVEDRNRSLTVKGIERAQTHAKILRDNLDFSPEFWVSSPAVRALHTATIFANEFKCTDNLRVQEGLYVFNKEELKSCIKSFPDVLDSAIFFGHNDACQQLLKDFCFNYDYEFKTSSIAVVSFKQNRWENVTSGELKLFISKEQVVDLGNQ